MAIARRVYLYIIAFVSLQMLIAGVSGLLQVIIGLVIERLTGATLVNGAGLVRTAVSANTALAVVGLIGWLLHWWLAERLVSHGEAVERRSALRKLYLYAVQLVAGLVILFAGSTFLTDALMAFLGLVTPVNLVNGRLIGPLAMLLVEASVWFYHARVAAADRAIQPETGAAATLRRWYTYILTYAGLVTLLIAATGLLRTIWEAIVRQPGQVDLTQTWLAPALAGSLGWLMIGLLIWYRGWQWSNSWFLSEAGDDPERRSVLRKVFLYLVTAMAVATTTWSAGGVLYRLMRLAFLPAEATWSTLPREIGATLAPLLIFGAAWGYHALVINREATVAGERRQQATIRWFYQYLVALVGLATLASGLVVGLATILQLFYQAPTVAAPGWWADQLSLAVTLAAVGLPLWLTTWLRIQGEAADPVARQSLVRRLYLFLVFGLTTLTLLGSVGWTLYQIINRLLGGSWTGGEITTFTWTASTALVAGLLLGYHLLSLRRDSVQGLVTTTQSSAEPVQAVAIIRASRPEDWETFQRELVRHTPAGVEVRLLPVTPAVVAQVTRLLDEPSTTAASAEQSLTRAPV